MVKNDIKELHHHKDAATLKENDLYAKDFQSVVVFFSDLANSDRIKIFWILCHQEANISYFTEMLGISEKSVMQHLRILKDCQLLVARTEGKDVFYKICDSETGRLMHKMVEELMELSCPEKKIDEQSTTEEIVFQVHEYLMEHMEERVTIEELSKKFLINTTTLKQVFKKVYGSSVAAHMKEHRLEKAASLLKNGNESIAQIARLVGYESQSKFSKSFQEVYGVLPSEYRKIQ